MISTAVIKELLVIGRSEHFEDPHVFDSLARSHDLGALNIVHWSAWDAVTAALSVDDLVALVKALTMMDNRCVVGGSVAGVIWVYQDLEGRNCERAHSLDHWVSTHTRNFWADFRARRRWRDGAHARELVRQKEQDEQHREAVARKVERATAAKRRSEQASIERATILGELESLSPRERLVCMAKRASHPPHYFPEQWTDITDDDLLAFDATSRNALILWLAPMRKGFWKRLYNRLRHHGCPTP